MVLLNLSSNFINGGVNKHADLQSHRIIGDLNGSMLDGEFHFRCHQVRIIVYGYLIHWGVVHLLLLLGFLLLLFRGHERQTNNIQNHPVSYIKTNVIIEIMFYFQYVIQSIKIDHPEFSPEIFIRFGQMSNKLGLPDLEAGKNSIGLGKQLALNISKEELEVWFKEYAFCIQLKGGVLNGRSLIGICSLSKLEYTDEVDGITITLKDLTNAYNTAELVFALKFKHIHHQVVQAEPPHPISTNKKENPQVQRKMSQTLRTDLKKPNSYLYGNSNSKITEKRKTHTSSFKKPKDLKKTTQFSKTKSVINDSAHQNQNHPENFTPYPMYHDKQVVIEIPTSDLFGQQYFCPPPMQFTNNPVEQTPHRIIPHKTPAPQIPHKQEKKDEMQNYSFQGNLKPQNKKIEKSRVRQAIEKKKIKQLVEQQFSNKEGYIVVPIKAQNGDILFKKLDEIKESDLENLVTKKRQIDPPKQKILPPSIIKTTSLIVRPETSPVNISVQYPEDFESMSLGNQSMLNKQFGTLSKIKKTEQAVVHEESISEISYSDNFESYSASRSNIKKSFDDISQSLRSFSQSFKR